MQRLTAFLAAAMLMTAGIPAAAAVAQQSTGPGVQPGAQFAGAVGVQGAEVEGEIEGRALDRRFAAADSNASRAEVVAAESERASKRLTALRDRRDALRERYQNGEISESEYRARLAGIAAESSALERRLNETAEVAHSLPPAVAREHGVNASALDALRADADSLNEGEAGEAARNIAGQGVGNGLGGPPDDVGPRGNASEGDGRGTDAGGPPDDPGNGDGAGDGAGNGNSSSGSSGTGAAGNTSGSAGDSRGNSSSGGDGSTGGGPSDDRGDGQEGSTGGDNDARDGGDTGADVDGESTLDSARSPGDAFSGSR